MALINLMTHLDTVSGKYAKSDKVYTKVRKFDNQVIGVRLKNPATNEPPSAAQQVAQTKFAAVNAQVQTTLANAEQKATYEAQWRKQKKYKTLHGYVFHLLYNNTSEEGGNNG